MFDNFVKEGYSHSNIIIPATGGKGCLMLGDFNSAIDAENIKSNNICTIITAATNMDHLEIDKSIKHIIYPLLDAKTQNISTFFQDNFDNIQSNLKKGGVLVHCAAGVSRSATLVIAYLMKKNSWGFRQAISWVRQQRPEVCPNLGFEMQLKKYEKEIGKKSEERLAKTMIPSKNNSTFVGFNEFISKQHNIGFPNIASYSRKHTRTKQQTKSRPMSKDEHYFLNQYDQFFQKGLRITSFGSGMKQKLQNYHSSSVYKKSVGEAGEQFNATDKKIAALMFQSKLSRSLGPNNNPLKKSDVKINGFR